MLYAIRKLINVQRIYDLKIKMGDVKRHCIFLLVSGRSCLPLVKETYYLIFNHFQINYQWFQRLYSVFEILKEKNPIFFLSAFSEQPNKTIQTNDLKYSTVSCIPLSLMFQCQDSHLRERKHTQTQTPTNPTFLFIFPFPANKHP